MKNVLMASTKDGWIELYWDNQAGVEPGFVSRRYENTEDGPRQIGQDEPEDGEADEAEWVMQQVILRDLPAEEHTNAVQSMCWH